jgi:hypothetical protein
MGRREGPSMAQRGYPGIHAGMPTTQYLRSASVVNGAPRSKAREAALQPAWLFRVYANPLCAGLPAKAA